MTYQVQHLDDIGPSCRVGPKAVFLIRWQAQYFGHVKRVNILFFLGANRDRPDLGKRGARFHIAWPAQYFRRVTRGILLRENR